MLHITHVITTIDRGGAEKHLLQLASAQVAAGHKVRVIFLKGKAELLQDFERSGCEVITHISNKGLLQQLLGLRTTLAGFQGVTHAHLPKAELLSALSVSKKIFVSRHNAEKFFPTAPDFISRILSRFVSSRSTACIAISQSVEVFLRTSKEWDKSAPIQIVYYGFQTRDLDVSVTRTELRAQLGIPQSAYLLGTVARITPQKDFPTLLRAFAMVVNKFPESFLVVVGEGDLYAEMQSIASRLGVEHRIKWIGKVENVDNYLQIFDVFVLASKYEGFGLVLLEAANANLPIVASNTSAIPEVLGKDYKYLFDAGNFDDLFAKLDSLRLTHDKYYIHSTNKSILSRFTIQKMLQETMNFYSR